MVPNIEHSTIPVNGVSLHVVASGNPRGAPVILLHGFPEFWYGWRHQVPALASAGYHVIVPDQRGYNLSSKPRGVDAYQISALAGDILALADHFGCEQVSLVGHDWGAAVAWYLAITQPKRLHRLAILNVPHPYVMSQFVLHSLRQQLRSWYIAFFQLPAIPEWLLSANNYAALARMLLASGKPGTFTSEDIAEYRQAWSQKGALTAMINWYRAAFRHRSSLALKQRVTVPTLVLWGRQDIALRAEMAERSLEWCDRGSLVFYEDATHWVQHDEAGNINLRLLEFFAGKG